MSYGKTLISKPYLLPFLLKTKMDDWYQHPDRTLNGSKMSVDSSIGKWKKLSDIPTYRYEFGGCYHDGKIFVVGGLTMPTVYTVTTVCETYDTKTGEWAKIANFPKIIHHPTVTSVGEKIYIVGGNGLRITPYKSTYQYDPQKNSWAQKSDMPTARGALGAVVLEGKIYAIGGGAHKVALDANEVYDPKSNTWEKLAPMPTKREHLSVCECNGRIYAMGGYEKSLSECLDNNEAYDPKTNSWEKLVPMPFPISGFSSSAIGTSIFVFGGEQGWAVSGECLEYDTIKDKWTRRSDLPTPRYASIAVKAENEIHVIGGNARLKGFEFSLAHEVFSL